MLKRTLAMLLSISLLLLCLAGCGSSSSSDSEAENETAEETTEEAEETVEDEAEEEEEAVEEENEEAAEEETIEEESEDAEIAEEATSAEDVETIEISYPLTDEEVVLTMWNTAPSVGPFDASTYGIEGTADYSSIQAVAEITGVTIEFVDTSAWTASEQFALNVAAGDWADMYINVQSYYNGGVEAAWEEDFILNLADYEEYYPNYLSWIESDPELEASVRSDDGSILQICSVLDEFSNSQGTIIRTDWLDELGLEVPSTIDELHEVLLAFQSEMGCEHPFFMDTTCNQLLTSFNLPLYVDLESNDISIYQIDGVVYSAFLSDSYREWLETMNQWYEEGLIDPDFVSVGKATLSGADEDLIEADELGVWWSQVNSIATYYEISPAENFACAGVYISSEEDGVNHIVSTNRLAGATGEAPGVAITATCENVELALGWLNFWYTDEGVMLMNYGVEGESYNLEDGEVVYTDLVLDSEYGLNASMALALYSIAGNSWGVQIESRTYSFFSDVQNEARTVWTEVCDGAWSYPNTTLTTDESAILAQKVPDIGTYIAESVPRFIMGEYNLESDWDNFQSTLIDMGLEECIQVYQDALDRYNER